MLASGNGLVSGKGVGEQGIHAAIVTLPALPCQKAVPAFAAGLKAPFKAIENAGKKGFQPRQGKR